jgi:hypothetical protein
MQCKNCGKSVLRKTSHVNSSKRFTCTNQSGSVNVSADEFFSGAGIVTFGGYDSGTCDSVSTSGSE